MGFLDLLVASARKKKSVACGPAAVKFSELSVGSSEAEKHTWHKRAKVKCNYDDQQSYFSWNADKPPRKPFNALFSTKHLFSILSSVEIYQRSHTFSEFRDFVATSE